MFVESVSVYRTLLKNGLVLYMINVFLCIQDSHLCQAEVNFINILIMKKLVSLAVLVGMPLAVFAYSDYQSHQSSGGMSGWEIFTLIVMIAYIILSVVVLMKWWKMTENVEQIREHLTSEDPKLVYLISIGESERARKAALKMLIDRIYPIYWDSSYEPSTKAPLMDEQISDLLPRIERFGIEVPDYAKSGERFIDYMNQLTGSNVPNGRVNS